MQNGRHLKRPSSFLNADIDYQELNVLGTLDVSARANTGELPAGTSYGNWGNKLREGAKFVRRGKLTAWSPSREDWEIEERARKRIKRILPPEARSPSPPRLPHLRSPSPPITAPYPPPTTQHLSYSSFVLDPAAQHSFRSGLLSDLERATCGLIEGETPLRRAIGRLWEVLADDPEFRAKVRGEEARGGSTVAKTEDVEGEDGLTEREQSLESEPRQSTAVDMTSNIHRLFLADSFHATCPNADGTQEEFLEKYLVTLRELHEDGREYVERLEEIHDGLGWVKGQKQALWTVVREHAVKEMEESEGL